MKALGVSVPLGATVRRRSISRVEAAADLHGLEPASEGLGEDAFDQTLEASLELL